MVNDVRIREKDLVIPALQLIAEFGDQEFGLEISVLVKKLREPLVPSPEDLEILKGRKDDRLSQVIRNLVSHRTLEKKGLAKYRKGSAYTRGSYVLTKLGHASILPAMKGQHSREPWQKRSKGNGNDSEKSYSRLIFRAP